MNLKIRPYRAGDARAIVELSSHYFPAARIDEEEIRRRISKRIVYLVAELDERVVGFIDVKVREKDVYIYGIAVQPEFKEKGIGSQLLEKVVQIAKKEGKGALVLTVKESNTRAIQFYSKRGFSLREVRAGREGEVLVLLRGVHN